MAGFIHNKLDIKLLVLYLTSRLAGPVDFPTLTDLTMCDDGVDYFQYAEAVSELIASGHLAQEGELYSITDKGRRNISAGESSLSPVIRQRCDQRLVPFNNALRRNAQVQAVLEDLGADGCQLRLQLTDESETIFSLTVWVPSPDSGQQIAERFRAHPERIYNGVLGVLLDDDDRSESK